MRKTGKILIGVLSVGALIGTGYAAWHLNNGFTSTQSGNVGVDVNDMIINSFAKVVVTNNDDKIKFDGDHEDLNLAYTVKAEKVSATETKDPYDLTLYSNVADDYIPDLQVSVKAYNLETGKALEEAELTKLTSYIVLPKLQEFSYTEWLSAEAKEKGHSIDLSFGWASQFEGMNPQEYFKAHTEIDRTEAENTIKEMTTFLKTVTYKVHFDVGHYVFTEPDKSGEVTIPTIANSTLTIDGLESGKLTAGEHEIRIALDEGKQIKDNKLTVVENGIKNEVTLTEAKIRAIGKTYSCTYNFKKGATYSFEYVVENIPPKQVALKEGAHEHVTFTTAEGGTIDFTKTLAVGETFKFKATAEEGYKLETVKHNETTLTAKEGVYEFVAIDGDNTISATASLIPVVQKYKVTLDDTSTAGAKLLTEDGKDLDLAAEYEVGTKVKFKVGFDEATHKVTEVTNNGTKLTDTNGVYEITISEVNKIKVTLEELPTETSPLDRLIPATITELAAQAPDKENLYVTTGIVVDASDSDKYGNITIADKDTGATITAYGTAKDETCWTFGGTDPIKFTNPKDFNTNCLGKLFKLGDEVKFNVYVYNFNNQSNYNLQFVEKVADASTFTYEIGFDGESAKYFEALPKTDYLLGEEVMLTPKLDSIPEGKALRVFNGDKELFTDEQGNYVLSVAMKNTIRVELVDSSVLPEVVLNSETLNVPSEYGGKTNIDIGGLTFSYSKLRLGTEGGVSSIQMNKESTIWLAAPSDKEIDKIIIKGVEKRNITSTNSMLFTIFGNGEVDHTTIATKTAEGAIPAELNAIKSTLTNDQKVITVISNLEGANVFSINHLNKSGVCYIESIEVYLK